MGRGISHKQMQLAAGVISKSANDQDQPVRVRDVEQALEVGESIHKKHTSFRTANNLLLDAWGEIFAVLGMCVKFAAFVILLLLIRNEAPVAEYYPVNRAVKNTFMVDQAMEARGIQDTWEWLFAVLDRISSHSRQTSMDDIETYCQGVGQIELTGGTGSSLTAAYGPDDAYVCSDAGKIDLDKRQVFVAPNNELILFSISQHRSTLKFDGSKLEGEDKGFVFDSIYNNKAYHWSSFARALDITRGDDQMIGVFGEWKDKGAAKGFGGLASGDDDKDYATAYYDGDAQLCVFSDAFSPEQQNPTASDDPHVTGSTLQWEGMTFTKDGFRVPAFYPRDPRSGARQMARIMDATNNSPKEEITDTKDPMLSPSNKIEVHPCWLALDPANAADVAKFTAMGYKEIGDIADDMKVYQSEYVPIEPLTGSVVKDRFGIKKVRPIRRWQSICAMMTNDEFAPIDSPIIGGIFSWHRKMLDDRWLQDVCTAVEGLPIAEVSTTYGFFAWPVTASLLTPSQGDECEGDCDGKAPEDELAEVYGSQVIIVEDDLGLGRFILDRAHLTLNQKLDWIDGNTRDMQVNIVSFNGNNDAVMTTMIMKFKFDTAGDVRAEFDIAMVPAEYDQRRFGNQNLIGLSFTIVALLILLTLKTAFELGHAVKVFMFGDGDDDMPVDTTHKMTVWSMIYEDLSNASTTEIVLDVSMVSMTWVHFIFNWTRGSLWGKTLKEFYEYTTDDTAGASVFEETETLLALIKRTEDTLELNDYLKLFNCILVLVVTFQMLYSLSQVGMMVGYPKMGVVTRTLNRCFVDLLPLLLVFLLVLVTFGMLGHVTFGLSDDAFRSFWVSMGSVMQMLIGMGPDFDDLSNICYRSGETTACYINVLLYFWSYVTINTILVLNMVLAVVFDIYEEVMNEMDEAVADHDKLGPYASACLVLGYKTAAQALEYKQQRRAKVLAKQKAKGAGADAEKSEVKELKKEVEALNNKLDTLISAIAKDIQT